MLFYPAALPLSSRTLSLRAGIIRRHRKNIGSCWRKLSPGRQALLVLAYLRKGETFAELAAGFGVGTATAWRYVTETVALLAARSPKLRRALAGAKDAGHAYVVIDGTLIAIDRVAADRPFYSGKHRRHGMNLQVISAPDGEILWVSGPLPGAVHDLTAARIWGIVRELAAAGLIVLADKGYIGAGEHVHTPYRGRNKPASQKDANRAHAQLRHPVNGPMPSSRPDCHAFPGRPVAPWPPAIPGENFAPPTGRGLVRLVSDDRTGRCPACGRAWPRRKDATLITHAQQGGSPCPGSGQEAAEDLAVASWLAVLRGLTPHGLRHGLQTWMDEDGIPEVLKTERMGHEMPGMHGVYGHVSPTMRANLKAALQERWETSLRERAQLSPRSIVPVLDRLLAAQRGARPRSAPISLPKSDMGGRADATAVTLRVSDLRKIG